MPNLGIMEIGIIAGVVLLIFGPKQIPKFGRAMGQTIKEFRGVRRELEHGLVDGDDDEKGDDDEG